MTETDQELLRPWVPDGYDAFWAEAFAETARPLRVNFSKSEAVSTETHSVTTFELMGLDGQTRHGWIAKPLGMEGPFPAFVWSAPYGRWSMKPNKYGTRPGYVSICLNFHGESAFHDEAYKPERGYFAVGIESPKTWIFRRLFQDSVLCVRTLTTLDSVDSQRIGAMGMSQGAGISIWLGAFCPEVRSVVADMPFLSGMPWVLNQPIHRYPLKELADWVADDPSKMNRLKQTVAYFDTVNAATRCRVPALLTAGRKDPAVRVPQVNALFDTLAGPKEFVELDWGHDWHPSMIDRNKAWLDKHLN